MHYLTVLYQNFDKRPFGLCLWFLALRALLPRVGPSVLLSARWAWADTHRSYVCLYIVLSKCRHGTVYTNPLLYIHIDSHDLVLKDYISKGAHARVCTCARTRERDCDGGCGWQGLQEHHCPARRLRDYTTGNPSRLQGTRGPYPALTAFPPRHPVVFNIPSTGQGAGQDVLYIYI
jgi:hypothetical protein